MTNPFWNQLEFVIYSSANAFVDQFVVDGSADMNLNGIHTTEFTIPDDDTELLDAVTQAGARCAVRFRNAELFRGRVAQSQGEGPNGDVTVHVDSDMQDLWHVLAWMVPTADLAHQTVEYRTVSGKSEAVFKAVLRENITRLGLPWTVVADHGYGTALAAPLSLRMDVLADKLIDALSADRLIITVTYDVAGHPVWDVKQPDTVKGPLTVDSGVIASYTWSHTAATMTRAVGGGRGDGVDREYKQYVDTALEAALGTVLEGYVDVQSTDDGVDITPQIMQAVMDAGPRQSLACTLAEQDEFQFLSTFRLGSLARALVGPVDITQQIGRVSITCTGTGTEDAGTTVAPSIGDVDTGDDQRFAKQIAQLARGQRELRRR